MQRNLLLTTAFSLAVAAAPIEAGRHNGPVEIWQTAEVEISAGGRISTVRWLDERPAARLVTDRIEPRVRAWQFEPGEIDGVAQPTRTFVQAQVLAEASGAELALRIGRVVTGPYAVRKVIPRYPFVHGRAGISGRVTAVLRVEPDGSVAFESLDFWRPGNRTAGREEFVEATRSALAQWRYEPERVGGRDVPVHVRIPVEFCAPDTNCTKLFRQGGAGDLAAQDRPGEAVALDSAARLLTRVDGESI